MGSSEMFPLASCPIVVSAVQSVEDTTALPSSEGSRDVRSSSVSTPTAGVNWPSSLIFSTALPTAVLLAFFIRDFSLLSESYVAAAGLAFRFETDFEPGASCLGVFFKGPRRRHTPAAFQTGDLGLRGLPTLRHLLLREACSGTGFDQGSGERKPVFQRTIFAPVRRIFIHAWWT